LIISLGYSVANIPISEPRDFSVKLDVLPEPVFTDEETTDVNTSDHLASARFTQKGREQLNEAKMFLSII